MKDNFAVRAEEVKRLILDCKAQLNEDYTHVGKGTVKEGDGWLEILGHRCTIYGDAKQTSYIRRLHGIINDEQLTISTDLADIILTACGYQFENKIKSYPITHAAARERVEIEAEFAGIELSEEEITDRARKMFNEAKAFLFDNGVKNEFQLRNNKLRRDRKKAKREAWGK